jgi:hypothetical protein
VNQACRHRQDGGGPWFIAPCGGSPDHFGLGGAAAKSADPHISDHQQRVLLDEMRGHARELGDVSLREARKFQLELEKIASQLMASHVSGDNQSEPRRWRVKP